MLLITGGAYQGKLKYALDITGLEMNSVLDGEYCQVEDAFQAKIIYGFHEIIKKLVESDEDVEEYLKKLISKNPEAVVIVNEVGSGVIPINPIDRKYRETVGRASCLIAKNSEEVHRVMCGLGVKIKNG